jgi:ribosome-binding protein aMBF1 (putative translation factor)
MSEITECTNTYLDRTNNSGLPPDPIRCHLNGQPAQASLPDIIPGNHSRQQSTSSPVNDQSVSGDSENITISPNPETDLPRLNILKLFDIHDILQERLQKTRDTAEMVRILYAKKEIYAGLVKNVVRATKLANEGGADNHINNESNGDNKPSKSSSGIRPLKIRNPLGLNGCAWESISRMSRRTPEETLVAIKRLRKALGWSQSVMAAAMGVGVNTFLCWEHGTRLPSAPARRLVEILEMILLPTTEKAADFTEMPAAGGNTDSKTP